MNLCPGIAVEIVTTSGKRLFRAVTIEEKPGVAGRGYVWLIQVTECYGDNPSVQVGTQFPINRRYLRVIPPLQQLGELSDQP